ncbi:MAG: hypothetical protein KQJ78_25975, partial [Deltaproteobacteria bacterium]|nr:hypothetical protein [Deltaproteobacteria bacterium]
MTQLVTNTQLAQVLGVSRQHIEKHSASWRVQFLPGRGGQIKHYEVSSMPPDIQRSLLRHRLKSMSLGEVLEPRRSHPESAASLYKLPQPVLELALAKAKVVKLAEAVMELGKIEGVTRKEALDRWLNEFNRGRV